MNREQLITGVRKTWEVAKAIGVGDIFSNPMPLVPSDSFREISINPDASYEEVYLAGTANSDYNILLADFAFFQFGLDSDDHTRFAYYPNPFLGSSREVIAEIGGLREFVDEGVITVEEFLHKLAEVRRSQHPPLIRYENAPRQYVEFRHPCSHLHLGHHPSNRWAVSRSLTPLAFALTILRSFYGEAWYSEREYSLFGVRRPLDDLLAAEKVNCRVLSDELLSAGEKAHFVFS